MAAAMNNNNPDVLRALLKAGADPNAKNSQGMTAQQLALAKNNKAAIGFFQLENFVLLCAYASADDIKSSFMQGGAIDINGLDSKENTALMGAIVMNPNPGVIQTLLMMGADANTGSKSLTPLIASIMAKKPDAVKNLLFAGADVNATVEHGLTPLMVAAHENAPPEILDILLKAGANVNARNSDGHTAADMAEASRNFTAAKLLGGTFRMSDAELLAICELEPVEKLQSALDFYGEVSGDIGLCLVVAAAQNKDNADKIMDFLQTLSPPIHINYRPDNTPLLLALDRSYDGQIIRKLLDWGANVNLPSRSDAASPLVCAVNTGASPEIVRLLIEKGADVNYVVPGRNSVLMYAVGAAARGELSNEVVEILLNAGASLKQPDGTSIAFVARMMGNNQLTTNQALINMLNDVEKFDNKSIGCLAPVLLFFLLSMLSSAYGEGGFVVALLIIGIYIFMNLDNGGKWKERKRNRKS